MESGSFWASLISGLINRPIETIIIILALALGVWFIVFQYPKIRKAKEEEKLRVEKARLEREEREAGDRTELKSQLAIIGRVIENNSQTIANNTRVFELYSKSFEGLGFQIANACEGQLNLRDEMRGHDDRVRLLIKDVATSQVMLQELIRAKK